MKLIYNKLSCESRNHTGIQLIDRNDELCIFYEKIQHLETEINNLYRSILDKEQSNSKLLVDIAEIQRYIDVNRKKMPLIPDLSNQIKELDNELKILNNTLDQLVNTIEMPGDSLKKELPGEDPDIEHLKLKFDQLSDMLNDKKEELLEKDLINQEINEISEQLRKKAVDDRGRSISNSQAVDR